MRKAHDRVEEDSLAFGPFQLNRTTHTLSKGGTTIPVRSRAMGVLMALTDAAGDVVSNRELLRRIWPNVVVESGTVRVHVAQLRAVLRQADPDNDYVHNVTGQGYRFAMPVVRPRRWDARVIEFSTRAAHEPRRSQSVPGSKLPRPTASVWGLDRTRSELLELVANKRLTTVTGPGGIGKTTAAILCAEALAETDADGVCFLDLAAIERPEQIWNNLATMLGMPATAAESQSEVLAYLAERSLLLVLDNCEHLVNEVSRLAEKVLLVCSQVRILATSREPLRVRAEVVYELAGLDLPTAFERRSHETLLRYPAIRLFVERAGAEFDEQQLSLIEQICRRLDGNPLAIEIAAGQCRWVGLTALAVGLDDEMYLSMEGQRTSHPRHQTLRASLAWSYGLLTAQEQTVLQRLSELPGRFTVERAAAAIENEHLPRPIVVSCLLGLARKSLLVRGVSGQDVCYGMHDLDRAFARSKRDHSQEIAPDRGDQLNISIEAAHVESAHRFVGLWQSARTARVQ